MIGTLVVPRGAGQAVLLAVCSPCRARRVLKDEQCQRGCHTHLHRVRPGRVSPLVAKRVPVTCWS